MSITFYAANVPESLNVSNVNARQLLAAMDIEFDYSGSIVGIELAARASRALEIVNQLAMDEGVPATEYRQADHATMIDCGRSEGYFQDRLSRLHTLGLLAGEAEVYYD